MNHLKALMVVMWEHLCRLFQWLIWLRAMIMIPLIMWLTSYKVKNEVHQSYDMRNTAHILLIFLDQPVLTNNNSDNTNHAVQEQLHPEKQGD